MNSTLKTRAAETTVGRWVISIIACVLLVAAAPAIAGVGGSIVPSFPTPLKVGDIKTATITINNSSTAPNNTENVNVSGLYFAPSCASTDGSTCLTPDVGVFQFATSIVGKSGTSCAGIVFSAGAPDGTTGEFQIIAPVNNPLVLGPSNGAGPKPRQCVLNVNFLVVREPQDSTPSAMPLTTATLARATFQGATSGLTGMSGGGGSVTVQASQAITFGALADRAFGSVPFTVSGTASSGLAVTFSSLTTSVCTVSGSTVTLIAGGTCSVRAAQAGDSSYAPAPNLDRSFMVTPASQTISFGALANRVTTESPIAVSASATSGLTVTFTSLTGAVCAVSGSSVTLVTAGTCTIRASQSGNGNYAAAPNVDQSFTVTLATQTITFGALTDKAISASPVTVSATASSGLAVTFSSLTPAVCSVAGTTVSLLFHGTCTIRASQPGNTAFAAAANVDQSFVVSGSWVLTYSYDAAGNVVGVQRSTAP